jgi:hypothetical protein
VIPEGLVWAEILAKLNRPLLYDRDQTCGIEAGRTALHESDRIVLQRCLAAMQTAKLVSVAYKSAYLHCGPLFLQWPRV